MKNSNLNYKLIARYLAGECSKKEEEEIKFRMNRDPEFEKLVLAFRKVWKSKSPAQRAWNVDEGWRLLNRDMEITQRIQSSRTRHSLKKDSGVSSFSVHSAVHWFIRIAAVFLVVGLAGLFTMLYFEDVSEGPQTVMQEVSTEKGQRSRVALGDGSQIYLHSESNISYPEHFGIGDRIIYLSGEAYFDIAHDENRPFFVYTDEVVIQVLGTEFNIQAYSDEDINVVVADGKVSVSVEEVSDDKEGVFLEIGDKASLRRRDSGNELIVTRNVDLGQYLGWMEYRYTFDNVPMKEVARKLERWYGININFSDPEIGELSISATFEGESVQEVLRIIEIALDLEHEMDTQKVIFSRSGK